MNKLLVVALSAALVYFGIAAYGSYRSKSAEPPLQFFAGEPIEVKNESLPPSLYPCIAPDKEILYLVVAVSGEFMMFDQDGAWVTDGQFFEAKTDKGVDYYHAEVGTSLMALQKTPKGWRLIISTEKGVTELGCI